ncbi:MAG: histidine kinase, partial [Eubacterium sp.]|nr:histidine kinase [Eubacterium sp.]
MIFLIGLKFKSNYSFKGVMYSSVFMLLVGLWSTINYDYISLFYLPLGFINIADNLFLFTQVPMLAAYMHTFSQKKGRYIFAAVEALGCCNVALYMILTFAGKTDALIYRGMFVVLCWVLGIACVIAVFSEYDKDKGLVNRLLWISCAITVIAAIIEPMNVNLEIFPKDFIIKTAYFIFAIVQFVMSLNIIRYNIYMAQRTAELENEVLQSQMTIMVSQIQPHFLYNSLTAIQQLCDIDAGMAKDAVTKFAKYLRGNMDSLSLTKPILFEREMKHVENYLALEKMRFDD